MKTILLQLAFCAIAWVPMLVESDESPWIELSYQFNNKTIYWPTASSFKHILEFANFTAAGYYYSAYQISASEHGGTHLDSPRHFSAGKWTTDQIPLDRLIGPAIKINISSKAAKVNFLSKEKNKNKHIQTKLNPTKSRNTNKDVLWNPITSENHC